MIIGELDLERAQRDPAYLARVKAFLVSGARINGTLFSKLPEPSAPRPASCPMPAMAPVRNLL